jgi:hypothetical protein
MGLTCSHGAPRLLNWQLDTQQWHKGKNGAPGHWRYYKFNKQHHLVPPHSAGFHSDGQETKCSPGTFRTAVQIWGTSSSGLVDPGEMFCTEPGFKIRSCKPKGPGRARPRVHRVHPSVPGQKTVKCDPLPGRFPRGLSSGQAAAQPRRESWEPRAGAFSRRHGRRPRSRVRLRRSWPSQTG